MNKCPYFEANDSPRSVKMEYHLNELSSPKYYTQLVSNEIHFGNIKNKLPNFTI